MKILLATDGSEHSEKAAKFLTRFNFSPGDEIHIMHAVSWSPIISEWEVIYDNIREIKEDVVPRILDSAATILKPVKAGITSSFTEDLPDKAIAEKALETGADIIAIGRSGTRGIRKRLGSISRYILNHSVCSVLVGKSLQ